MKGKFFLMIWLVVVYCIGLVFKIVSGCLGLVMWGVCSVGFISVVLVEWELILEV